MESGDGVRRVGERAKVMIEYGPAENSWVPIDAPGNLKINCFWVSGQYKGKGYAKALLGTAMEDAKTQGKYGLITVARPRQLHYMSAPKWLKRQEFVAAQELPYVDTLWVL